jgi:signal recognition particle receptor subunit beta
MVFFNYATMQMAAKIVYYGPGLCGKTTNLHHIYAKTSPQSRGEMVSLETETDRTLFFDLLPIDVGVIGGFKTRLQLYTIPGQVFYNTTRKLVLKGVDGIVFVADSQKAMLDANLESFKNLRENLAEIGLSVDELPLVLQLNKRDLPNVADPATILGVLDPEGKYESAEAVASKGDGVFETLKLISKLTLRQLRRRMTGEESSKPASRTSATFRVQSNEVPTAQPQAQTGTRKVNTAPIPAMRDTPPTFVSPAPAPSVVTPIIDELIDEMGQSEIIEEAPAPPAFDPMLAKTAALPQHIIADAPIADFAAETASLPEAVESVAPEVEAAPPEPEPEPFAAAAPAAAPSPEPEIDFSQTEKPAKAAPEVKHVKVRSSVDVMAELESLRKKATQTTSKPLKKEDPIADMLAATKPKRDVHKSLHMSVAPDVLPKSRRVRVAVSFESDNGVLQTQEQVIELGDASDVGTLSVNLKLEP